jgi:hypothetical protein
MKIVSSMRKECLNDSSVTGKHEWTEEIKKTLVSQMVGFVKGKSPKYAHDYCECVIEKISKMMSYDDYIRIENDTNEISKIIIPLTMECKDEIKRNSVKADTKDSSAVH